MHQLVSLKFVLNSLHTLKHHHIRLNDQDELRQLILYCLTFDSSMMKFLVLEMLIMSWNLWKCEWALITSHALFEVLWKLTFAFDSLRTFFKHFHFKCNLPWLAFLVPKTLQVCFIKWFYSWFESTFLWAVYPWNMKSNRLYLL